MSLPLSERAQVAVLAFGTHGDVLPVAVVAAELAKRKPNYAVTFITHAAHNFLKGPLGSAGVFFHPISTVPVALPPDDAVIDSSHVQSSEYDSNDYWKVHIEQQHRKECLLAVEQVFGQQLDHGHNVILFNFFALEGWHLAELYHVPCAVAAPYVVPYSAPASFERKFRAVQPLLYDRLQHSEPDEVGWGEVMHWMWPLFTDRWTKWRSQCLHLSACPLTDPVTELPISQGWPRAPPLLYGFSQAVVECPGYWPRSIHVCGFWYAPPEWEEMNDQPQSSGVSHSVNDPGKHRDESCSAPLQQKLFEFLSQSTKADDLPIFVGLSSIGSMGYLRNPETFLKVIMEVLETLSKRAVLFSGSYEPLDAAILAAISKRELPSGDMDSIAQNSRCRDLSLLKDGISLHSNRLFCFSGFLAYNWLFPKCSMVIHHGGSGTTAAALRSGVPQIICPFVLDQFYWAERMAWIGVAPQPLKPIHLCPSQGDMEFWHAVSVVVNAVTEASRSGLRETAAAWRQKICQEDGVQKFVEILCEQLSF